MNRAAQALAGLVAVFRNENLRRLELGWGAAITAEWAHFVALGVFAYDAGGAVGVGIAGLVRMLPAALVAPFAASLGDRFRRERFLVSIALVGAAALAASAVVFFVSENAPAIFALAAVVGLSATLVRPAQQALLPSLARTPEELIGSNGATSTIESLGTLVGPLLAGVLVSVADAGVVFAVGAGALLLSALLFFRVRVEGRLRTASEAGKERAHRLLLAGLAYVARTPTPRMVVGLVGAQAFVRGCLNVLIVVTAFRVLDGNAAAVGYMTAALGVGGLVGALAAFKLEGRRLAVAFGIALVFWGLPIALMASSSFLATALLLLAVVGAPTRSRTWPRSRSFSGSFPTMSSPACSASSGAWRWEESHSARSLPPRWSSLSAPAPRSSRWRNPPALALLAWRRLVEVDGARPARPPS